MIFKILITVLALAPNLLIGYLFLNKDAIIENQKKALLGALSGQISGQLSKQTNAIKNNMGSMLTETIKPEIKAGDQNTLKAIPKNTGPALPF